MIDIDGTICTQTTSSYTEAEPYPDRIAKTLQGGNPVPVPTPEYNLYGTISTPANAAIKETAIAAPKLGAALVVSAENS